MSKPNFILPNTKKCIVKFLGSNGQMAEVTIDTPPNNAQLIHVMLTKHRVGYGQLRAIKSDTMSGLKTLEHVNVAALLPQRFTKSNRLEPMFA